MSTMRCYAAMERNVSFVQIFLVLCMTHGGSRGRQEREKKGRKREGMGGESEGIGKEGIGHHQIIT